MSMWLQKILDLLTGFERLDGLKVSFMRERGQFSYRVYQNSKLVTAGFVSGTNFPTFEEYKSSVYRYLSQDYIENRR